MGIPGCGPECRPGAQLYGDMGSGGGEQKARRCARQSVLELGGVMVCERVERTLKALGKGSYTGKGGAEDGRACMERVSRSGQGSRTRRD